MDGALLIHEAAELWDLFLMHSGEWVTPPRHLRPALDRLRLWEMGASLTLH
jgi:hypothetical protein